MTTLKSDSGSEDQDADRIPEAIGLINKGRIDTAEKILLDVVSRTPQDYSNSYEEDDKLFIKFWDQREFVYYVQRQRELGRARSMVWISNVYPRAHFYLGFIAIERKRYAEAIHWLDAGLALQPDHPILLSEKAKAVNSNGDTDAALRIYDSILEMGEDIEISLRAVTMRGIGVIYIDQGKLDEAEALFVRSMELDPDSSVAKNELVYIEQLRSGHKVLPSVLMSAKGHDNSRCKLCGANSYRGATAEFEGAMVFVCEDCIARTRKKWWQFWR